MRASSLPHGVRTGRVSCWTRCCRSLRPPRLTQDRVAFHAIAAVKRADFGAQVTVLRSTW